MNRCLTVLFLTLSVSCTTPGRGWVRADVIGPSVQTLAPYTREGVNASTALTPDQKLNLTREMEILQSVLEQASR